MSTETQTLTFEKLVKAPVKEVFRAFTNATALREWMCDVATVDPHPSGRFYASWNNGYYACGEYTSVQAEQEIALNWFGRNDPGPTQVVVTLSAGDGATRVSLVHRGLGTGEEWANTRDQIDRGWKTSLENLVSVLETGQDLRFVLRPMMGITFGEFNPEAAKKLGVPVTQGIRLDSTLEGMGARAAGLQGDDVIVEMAGQSITDYPSLTNTLQGYRAGNQLEVVFYRGPEKKAVQMELSRRPLHEIPATTAELAEILRHKFAEQDVALAQVFEGVTEEEASHKPAPDEWSAKEVLAHLVLGERYNPDWIAELEGGFERWIDDWGGNSNARTGALVAAYGTLPNLLEEMKRVEHETVAILAALAPEFMDRKGSYWRMAYNLLESPYHLNQHIDQIRAAIEAARRR